MELMKYGCDITVKTDDLPISTEAKLFYLTNCLRQYDYVKAQQASGIDHPKIKLDLEFAKQYCRNNDLGERDKDLIYEELREIDVLDENRLGEIDSAS
jgi:hypothetical protein